MTISPRAAVLVTGLSGAGKASILRVLEDLGFETVDNPPLHTLDDLVGVGTGGGDGRPLAAGIDTRTRGFSPAAVLLALLRLRSRRDLAVTLVYATAEAADRYRLAATSPTKIPVVEKLLARHPGEPTLVIGAYLDQLEELGRALDAPVIDGKTPNKKREELFDAFRSGDGLVTLAPGASHALRWGLTPF